MTKYTVWADGRKNEARIIEGTDMPEAIEAACDLFNVEADAVNIIETENIGEAEYYGVADAE